MTFIKRVVDLTGIIEEGMWLDNSIIHPPLIEQVASIEGPAGWVAHNITLSTLTGTYLEASAHVFPNGKNIDQIPIERFICFATIIHLPNCQPGYAISREDLIMSGVNPRPGDALLVSTGWERFWNEPNFVKDSPFFTYEAMRWLVDTKAIIIGGDMPSFESPTNPSGVIQLLFEAGCLLLAPLVNLIKVKEEEMKHPILVALPLPIKGVSGAPCRAVLIDFLNEQRRSEPCSQ